MKERKDKPNLKLSKKNHSFINKIIDFFPTTNKPINPQAPKKNRKQNQKVLISL
jgi:hypothetical protein